MRDDRSFLHDIGEAIDILRRYTPADRSKLDIDLPVQSLLMPTRRCRGNESAQCGMCWSMTISRDLNLVWNVVTQHIPVLQPQIEAILASLPAENGN